jgi:hypothetical protein
MEDFTLKNWPGKQPGDLADVYVALNGESFSKAVSLPLAEYGQDLDSSSCMGKAVIRCASVTAATVVALAAAGFVVPAQAQSVSADTLMKAKNNCLTSVAKTVGIPSSNLKVIQQRSDASGISVDVKVPKATAPWGCRTDRQGKVEDVHFKGSEGAL